MKHQRVIEKFLIAEDYFLLNQFDATLDRELKLKRLNNVKIYPETETLDHQEFYVESRSYFDE